MSFSRKAGGHVNKILCDGCQDDISETRGIMGYRIFLTYGEIPIYNGAIADVMIRPPLDMDYHFCGTNCLKKVVSEM